MWSPAPYLWPPEQRLRCFLTLRYQYRPGGRGHWYLAAEYFDGRTMSLFHFLSTNSIDLLRFLIPGHLFDVLIVLAAVAFLHRTGNSSPISFHYVAGIYLTLA